MVENDDGRTGLIFNIQKFCLHDGPGIRTTVFLKGCPLRCRWCANPESQSGRVQILWDREKCLYCAACVSVCPERAISMTSEPGIRIDEKKCTGCGSCSDCCPGQALTREGERRTVGDVLAVCLQDREFYTESGGGVTLSGGEPLLQAAFALNILQGLKEHDIHTAVETTGFVAPLLFQQACLWVDLFLFDIKQWDDGKHKNGTGVSNRLPLQNLKTALASGKEVLPRLPVIPGFNDTIADAEQFAVLLRNAGAEKVQLLPFHQFGEKKYEMLGRNYAYTDVPALNESDLNDFHQTLIVNGIDAFF
jgi:pyruvate formate lyase activating enzyme